MHALDVSSHHFFFSSHSPCLTFLVGHSECTNPWPATQLTKASRSDDSGCTSAIREGMMW